MYLPSNYFLLLLLLLLLLLFSNCFMGKTMEEIGLLWGYESESTEDLKQKLLHVMLELESVNKSKMELFDLLNCVYRERDELREALTKVLQKLSTTSSLNVPSDNVIPQGIPKTKIMPPNTSISESNSLSHGTSAMDSFHLLNIVYRERDELREELTKVLQNLTTISSLNVPNDNVIHQVIPKTWIMPPNTSITESNNLSHGTPAVDSFLDTVSSSDFSNMNVVDSQNVDFLNSEKTTQCDPASVVIENMIKGKALPQKGKLLQSVMEAGPLLQTLLVASPLPCWTNPPPIQDIKLPPFNLKDFESPSLCSNPSEFFMKAHGMCSSSSMLNFAINNPISWQSNPAPRFSYQVPTSKRQRL